MIFDKPHRGGRIFDPNLIPGWPHKPPSPVKLALQTRDYPCGLPRTGPSKHLFRDLARVFARDAARERDEKESARLHTISLMLVYRAEGTP